MGYAFISRALTFAGGPGSTEHTTEAFAVSDIVGPPLKANENWDGPHGAPFIPQRGFQRSVALRRGYSVE
jgi:hypothetical protein